MASKQPFECFVCKNNGFPAVMVYLAGKDEQGKAIRQEADGSPHQHKTKLASSSSSQQQQQQQQQVTTIADLALQIKLLHQKLDRIIDALDRQE
jgi:hypothetical protein